MRSRSIRGLALANLIAGCLFAVVFVAFAFRARFTVPYIDDWQWLASMLERPFAGGLWRFRNEHLIVVPRLLEWLDFQVWRWPGYATLLAGILSHVAIAVVLVRACFQERTGDEARLFSGSVLFSAVLQSAGAGRAIWAVGAGLPPGRMGGPR